MFEKIKELLLNKEIIRTFAISFLLSSVSFVGLIIYFGNTNDVGFAPSSGYDTSLTLIANPTDATITVSTINDDDGFPLALSESNKGYFTIDPGQPDVERMTCTGATGNTLTGCIRGLSADGSSETASTTLQHTHDVGSRIIMTNIAQFFNNYLNVWDDQIATGTKTFITAPLVPSGTPPSILSVASWGTITGLINNGVATSTEILFGGGTLATQIQMASSTHSADDPRLLYAKYATSSPDVRGLYLIVSENDGYLNQGWLDLTEDFAFSGANIFSGEFSSTASSSLASTTIQSGQILDTPTDSNDIVNKTYHDDNQKSTMPIFGHTQATVSMASGGTTYTVREEIGVGAFTMGANDMAIITVHFGTNSSVNNENLTVVMGNGTASTTIFTKDDTNYQERFAEFKIMNRNSVSAQIIQKKVFRSTTPESITFVTGTVDISNGFNVIITADNDTQNSRTGTSEYFNVNLLKP